MEPGLDGGEGDVDDEEVENEHEGPGHQHGQGSPRRLVPDAGELGIDGVVSHVGSLRSPVARESTAIGEPRPSGRIAGMSGPIVGDDGVARCPWAGDDPVMRAYHDTEWGMPV